jgi:hypothetical protein
VALRSAGRVGYLLADLEPTDVSARALIDYAALYAASEEGAVPYRTWPAAIKGHFLCRFPKAEGPKAADQSPAEWGAADLDSGDPEAAERVSAVADSAISESALSESDAPNPER